MEIGSEGERDGLQLRLVGFTAESLGLMEVITGKPAVVGPEGQPAGHYSSL
jgi:hypothetical protein